MISTQILLKSVRSNQYLQVLYINISEIIIPRKNPLIMGVFRIQFVIFANREKIFFKKCTKYLHKFEHELIIIMLLGNEKCQNRYFLCQDWWQDSFMTKAAFRLSESERAYFRDNKDSTLK